MNETAIMQEHSGLYVDVDCIVSFERNVESTELSSTGTGKMRT